MKVWIVGQFLGRDGACVKWQFAGVFDSEELAVKACRDENYFVGAAVMNKELPHETEEWPEAYYPIVRAA